MSETTAAISFLELSDRPAAVSVLVSAFWTYPETLHLLKSERTRRFGLARFMRSAVDDALPSGEVRVARDEGSVVGVAIWKPPSSAVRSGAGRLRQAVEMLPVGLLAPRTIREAISSSNAMRRRRPPQPHYYLAAIGVDPDQQGRGVGRRLIEPVFARADAHGAGCYLSTATPENVYWYTKLGFEVTATFRPTRSWPTVWTLWRPPASRANSPRQATVARGASRRAPRRLSGQSRCAAN